MLSWLSRYLSGSVKLQVKGASPERFLNLCSHHGIYVWNLSFSSSTLELRMRPADVRKLPPLLRKTNTRMQIRERFGLPFVLERNKKRKAYFAGFAACIFAIWILSFYMWDIRIVGNQRKTDETILRFLDSQGIHCGMRISQIDCSQTAAQIRKEFPEIIWVSVSTEGCNLIIRVEENPGTGEVKTESSPPANLVAQKDGIVASIITRSGIPLVQEGDEIQAGDILVAGNVPVTDDSGEIVNYQYETADADIFAYTTQVYESKLALTYRKAVETGRSKSALSLKIGSRQFWIGFRKTDFENYHISTEEKRIRLGEHFWLPFSISLRYVQEIQYQEKEWSEKEYQRLLTEEFQNVCQTFEKKGVQILQNDVKIYKDKEYAAARGTLSLLEPVGIVETTEKEKPPLTEEEGN